MFTKYKRKCYSRQKPKNFGTEHALKHRRAGEHAPALCSGAVCVGAWGRRTGLDGTREMEATDGATERFHVEGGA